MTYYTVFLNDFIEVVKDRVVPSKFLYGIHTKKIKMSKHIK